RADAHCLTAEAAAHVLADHAHVGLRNPQRAGEILTSAADPLRGDPRGQLVAFPLAYGAMRLHAGMRDDGSRIGFLDDVRCRLEASRQIAALLRLPGAHIPAGEDWGRRAR